MVQNVRGIWLLCFDVLDLLILLGVDLVPVVVLLLGGKMKVVLCNVSSKLLVKIVFKI